MAAVEAYQKTVGKLPISLRFIVEGEDGLGSPSLYRFTAQHPELLVARGCIWDEGYRDTKERPVISLGFKGITFLELRAHGARLDLHSKWGAIVPNPAWRLVQALATISSPKGVITIDGFSSNVAPICDEDAEALKAIELDEAGLKKEFRIGGWVRAMKGQALVKEHIFGPTCTICGIQTGHTEAGAKTVLPSTAMARLDFRLVPDLTPDIVHKLLRQHLDIRGFKDIEIIELGSAPLAKAPASSLVARAVIGPAHGSLWNGAAGLSDGSFEWTSGRCLRSFLSSYPSRVVWNQLRGLESAWPGREYYESMISCRASSSSGA